MVSLSKIHLEVYSLCLLPQDKQGRAKDGREKVVVISGTFSESLYRPLGQVHIYTHVFVCMCLRLYAI